MEVILSRGDELTDILCGQYVAKHNVIPIIR